MARVLGNISTALIGARGRSSPQPPNTDNPRPPLNPDALGSDGIGIRLNGYVIGGVKRLIQEDEILDIPNYWEYNVYNLDVEGRIDIDGDGMINIMNGGFLIETQSYIATAIDYTATNTDKIIEATGIGITITLPTALVSETGFTYKIDNSSGGNIFVVGQGGELIQGLASQTVPNNNCMNIFSNGTSWRIS